jgi:hypothetical protein
MNNPPAFPLPAHTYPNGEISHGEYGMTLRDYFAAKAMATAYSKLYEMFLDDVFDDWHSEGVEALAKEAYAVADAMLKAREA